MNNTWEDTFIKQFCKTIKQGTGKALLWDGEFANEPQFIIDFIHSLLKEQRAWNDAKYKLPDDGQEVIFINAEGHIRIGEYSDDEFLQGYWVNKCEQYLTKDIKYWMSLPEPKEISK